MTIFEETNYKSSPLRPAIPRGMRDILPVEAAERRFIEERLSDAFSGWGYGEVISPAFEFYKLLSTEAGEGIKREMFRFFDRDGRQLALRPEMTTPIARLAAQRLDRAAAPHRLYYMANVFREEPAQRGQQREFRQAGIELIGAGSEIADAEVVAIMIEALQGAGLDDFQVGIGQISFFKAIINTLDIDQSGRQSLINAASRRDLVGLGHLLNNTAIDSAAKNTIQEVLSLRGGIEVIDKAAALCPDAAVESGLNGLSRTFTSLQSLGMDERIIIDLGIIRGFDYYTGMIFEAYAPKLGFPLGGGGRYDNLLSDFGYPAAAAGFALEVERLHVALLEQSSARLLEPTAARYLVYSHRPGRALVAAAKLRADGKIAEVVLDPADAGEAGRVANLKGIDEIICAD